MDTAVLVSAGHTGSTVLATGHCGVSVSRSHWVHCAGDWTLRCWCQQVTLGPLCWRLDTAVLVSAGHTVSTVLSNGHCGVSVSRSHCVHCTGDWTLRCLCQQVALCPLYWRLDAVVLVSAGHTVSTVLATGHCAVCVSRSHCVHFTGDWTLRC